MGLFSRFENKVEDTVDGAADKVFDSPISPLQICKRAEKQMKREKMVGSGKQFAPTLYTVLVNPDDDDRLFGYYPTLAGEVETYLSAKAQDNGLIMDGQPLVRFIVDEGLRHGKFDIVAELVAAPIIEELRDEEMERYGLKSSQPQGGYPNANQYDSYNGYENYRGDASYNDMPYDNAPRNDFNQYGYSGQEGREAIPSAPQGQAMNTNGFSQQQQSASEQPDMQKAPQMPVASDLGQGQAALFAAGVAAGQVSLQPQAQAQALPEQSVPEAVSAIAPDYANQNPYEGYAPEGNYPPEGAWNNYPPYSPQQSASFAQQGMFGQNPYAQMNPYGQSMSFDSQNSYGQQMYGQPYPYMQGQPMSSQPFGGMPPMMGNMDPGMYAGAMAAGAMAAGAGQAFQQNIIPNTMVFNPATIQDAVQSHNSGRHVRARLLDRVNQRTYTLSGNRVVLGRETSCNIVVNDINASRRHADITKDDMGFWVLSDLQSTNGTFVNGRPVGACRLREGDLITIGMTTLVFTLS